MSSPSRHLLERSAPSEASGLPSRCLTDGSTAAAGDPSTSLGMTMRALGMTGNEVMSLSTLDERFARLLQAATDDPEVIGLALTGSRGKGF